EVVTPVMVKGWEKFSGTGGQIADCRQWWAPLERRGFRRGAATGRVAPRTWLVRGVPHMDRLARRLGLKTDPTIFFVSAGLMVVFLVLLLVFPGPIGDTFADGRDWIV